MRAARELVQNKGALLTSAALASVVWLSAGAEAEDRIVNFRVLGETPGGLIAAVDYGYDSRHGDNVFIAAAAETSAGASIGTWVRPWPITKRFKRAYVHLGYGGASPRTSQRVRFYMYEGGGATFLEQRFDFNKAWAREPDLINPDTMQTTFQDARELRFNILYLLTSSHSRPVRMGVTALKNGAAFPDGFGYFPSAPLVSGSTRTASTQLSYMGASNDSSEGLLVFLYEEGSPIFYQTVAPRMKYWASSTTDSDGDGISDTNESVLGTLSGSRDTDDDGLEDGWELEGYRWSGSQYHDSNLPFRGASPRHRDVVVEVDYIVDIIGGPLHSHRMHLDSIYKAKELYAAMGILNVDGTLGVNLLILPGSSIPFDGDLGGVCGMRRFPLDFPERKQRIYHWAIAGHGRGGQATRQSNRFVFGTGNGNPAGGTMSEVDKFLGYASFVHELGHNLGLSHVGQNGFWQTNCKANYPSLMNYAYDYAFNCSVYDLATTEIQFSGGGSPTLHETALREFGNVGLDYVRGFDSDGLGCNWYRANLGLVDWNKNDVYNFGPVSRDITGDAPSCVPNGLQVEQRDSNDFVTVIDLMDDSIERPALSDCDSAGPTNGYVHDADQRGFEPVCGIPKFDRLSDHPWLKVNPVFALRPGMEIRHPEMKRLLRGALGPGDRLRMDVPLEKRPHPGVDFDVLEGSAAASSERKRARHDDSEIYPRRDER